jgi:hypothetical protein
MSDTSRDKNTKNTLEHGLNTDESTLSETDESTMK